MKDLVWSLDVGKRARWGWVIYRTTYGSDKDWERFKIFIEKQALANYEESELPSSVKDAMEWTFVSDKTLQGASREALRERFRSWVAEAEPREQRLGPAPQGSFLEHYIPARYRYFVQVDEECLRSVVGSGPDGELDPGWVNLVRCEQGLDYDQTPEYLKERAENEAEAARHRDVYDREDWMQISSCSVSIPLYSALEESSNWWVFYRTPPDLVVY